MLKKFRKMTTLALVLALILAVSASVFAVNTWSHRWFASDGTAVEYYATINAARTYGYILSDSNQGEVNVDADYCYRYGLDGDNIDFMGYTDIDYAYVSASAPTGSTLIGAHYQFTAYVPTDDGGQNFDSGSISLVPEGIAP